MGTFVLHEHTFSCQAGNYPFEGEARSGVEPSAVPIRRDPDNGTLSVTFSVEADDVFSGTEAGAVVFCESANACGLRVTDVVSAAAEAVEHPASTRELQPA